MALLLLMCLLQGCQQGDRPEAAHAAFTMADDGGWCWFQDERAIIAGDVLVVGSVASGTRDPDRRGSIEVHWRNLVNGKSGSSVLHERL